MPKPQTILLIDLASETLEQQIMPKLSGEHKYQALMILKALKMAQNELVDNGQSARDSTLILRDLLEGTTSHSDPDDLNAEVTIQRELTRLIRQGAFDSGYRARRLHQALTTSNELTLRVTNPDRIAAHAF